MRRVLHRIPYPVAHFDTNFNHHFRYSKDLMESITRFNCISNAPFSVIESDHGYGVFADVE